MRTAALLVLLLAACGPVVETEPEPVDSGADAPAGDGEAAPPLSTPMPLLPSDGQPCTTEAECGSRRRCDLDAGVCRWR